jgi:glutamyl-tRNA reductase
LSHALQGLARLPHVKEAAVLSTCNRTEVYAVVSNVQAGWREIDAFFASAQSISDHEVLRPNFRLLREDVALHLFRVSSGLDSMVLGEGQIVAQVKAAHQAALEAKTAGPVLDQLFKFALTCGKRVRTETSMARRAVSVSSAAVELGRELLGSLAHKNIVVIGAGKMAQICIKVLLGETGTGKIIVVNRSRERVQKFLQNNLPNKERLHSEFEFEDRHSLAAAADLVLVSASAPDFLLNKDEFARYSTATKKQTCIIDISVPRNVDPSMEELPGVRMFHSDDLANIVATNLAEREALVSEAQEIVYETLDEFHGWQRALLVVPTIAGLREKIEAIRQEQMAKNRSCCDTAPDQHSGQQIEDISRAIVNQILHHPTVQLKATKDYEILRQQAEALRTLFSLDPLGTPSTENSRKPPQRKKPH